MIGIMQGRLLPPMDGRIQSFPAQDWRKEFPLAREAGLDCIEWVYEAETYSSNPLKDEAGIGEIRSLSEDSGVRVHSICADQFMVHHLVAEDGTPQSDSVDHLRGLIARAHLLGARYIVLPFVDASSLQSSAQMEGLVTILESQGSLVERTGVELHLETDLAPTSLASLFDRIAHPLIRANYDIGNSASLGYDPKEELTLIGPQLGSVHVKDRVRGGGTVALGTGSADFDTCFRLILAAGFQGPFILQAARGRDGDEVPWAKQNREFVEAYLTGFAH